MKWNSKSRLIPFLMVILIVQLTIAHANCKDKHNETKPADTKGRSAAKAKPTPKPVPLKAKPKGRNAPKAVITTTEQPDEESDGSASTPIPKVDKKAKGKVTTAKPKVTTAKPKSAKAKPKGRNAPKTVIVTTEQPPVESDVTEITPKQKDDKKSKGKVTTAKPKTTTTKPKATTTKPNLKPKGRSTIPECLPSDKTKTKPKGRSMSAPSKSKYKGRSFETPKTLTEEGAFKFVRDIENQLNEKCHLKTKAEWDYVTNLTMENQKKSTAVSMDFFDYHKNVYYKQFMEFPWKSFKDPTLKRQFYLESNLGISILPEDKMKHFTEIKSEMTQIYSTAKVCDFKEKTKCDMSLDPHITSKMAESRDYDELKHLWISWREESGKKMPKLFAEYVEISNEAAVLNGYHDMGELWRRPYENDFMHLEMWALWGQIRPLYEQIHAYTRRKLKEFYKKDEITLDGTIPAHVLGGNMWSQNWAQIYADILNPFKDTPNMDVTDAMISKNYTVLQMFKESDDFFQSLGLIPMNEDFWKNSIIERPPPPREIVCHPEAWDLCNKKDFVIKECAVVSMRDYITVHHEMGHIQYYMQYMDQLNTFREGANPAFHEAIGDTIAMSVSSPQHLKTLGLLGTFEETESNTITFLLSQALKVLVDIPWSITLEQWRWDVFSGKVKPEDYNCHWWKLRTRVQGVKPPVKRSSTDFDPGAKYHVPNSTPYARYFFARILTYQFHEALCKEAGQFVADDPNGRPLYQCDIYKSKKAGDKLAEMLKLGSSRPWPEALQVVTGTKRMDAKPVINYFAPLMKWLEKENAKNNEIIGWVDEDIEQICEK